MSKIYRYFFYQFYQLSKNIERQWPLGVRMPLFTANLLFAIFSMFLFSSIVLLLEIDQYNNYLGLIHLPLAITVFALNYFFIVKPELYKLDEIRFDSQSKKTRGVRKLFFIIFVILVFVFFIIILMDINNKMNKFQSEQFEKINIGMPSTEVIKIIGYPVQRFISPENINDSIYYYRFSDGSSNGAEIYIDNRTHRVKWKKSM